MGAETALAADALEAGAAGERVGLETPQYVTVSLGVEAPDVGSSNSPEMS